MARALTMTINSLVGGSKEDRIGVLSHSSGTITLAPSTLTIGGRQLVTPALPLSVGTVTANTLYFLYVVFSVGNPKLIQSTNVNSTGPVGYADWKLVGAYYANGLSTPTFGAFCTIEGCPLSGEIIQASITHYASGSNPGKAAGSPDWATWQRDGDKIIYQYSYNSGSSAGGGSGNWYWPTPTNLLIDLPRVANLAFGHSNADQIGEGRWGNWTIAYGGHMFCAANNRLGMISWQTGGGLILNIGSSANVNTASPQYGGFLARLPIVGMTTTPLKDL